MVDIAKVKNKSLDRRYSQQKLRLSI